MQRIMIAGATGLIGQQLLQELLADKAVLEVHAFVRRPLAFTHDKLRQHVQDLSRLDQLQPGFTVDTAFNCLGTTIRVAGSQDAFRAVDQHGVLAFARLARRAGASHFLSVSAIGASAASSNFYSRVKGEVERDLKGLGFASLTLMQPSLLTGPRQEFRLGEQIGHWLSLPLAPLMVGPLAAYRPVPSAVVAKAMARAGSVSQPGVQRVTWRDMQRLISA